jgi:carbon monoxide dehydrogenase subunit G
MEIEGTFTFAAPLDRVFTVLTDPEALGRAIPGCERIMQLGPAGDDGTLTVEVRLRANPGAAVYAATAEVTPRREPTDASTAELRVELRGRGPAGPVTAHGTLHLAAEGDLTQGQYRWGIEPSGLRESERNALDDGDGAHLAARLCEQLAAELRDGDHRPPPGVVWTETPRGRIVAVQHGQIEQDDNASAVTLARQALWMSAGLVVGLSALALTISLTRRFRPRQ